MADSFLKNYFWCTLYLLFSHFLILFGSGFLALGSFRLTPMTYTNEEAPPLADIVVKQEETKDDKVKSLTQALPASKRLSKKAKVSHVCEAVDKEKYIEPVRRKIHILKLESDGAAKLDRHAKWTTALLRLGWSHYGEVSRWMKVLTWPLLYASEQCCSRVPPGGSLLATWLAE